MAILPNGYIELKYIESTGTQYIDTGFKPNQNTRIIVDLEVLEIPQATSGICGARTAYNVKNYSLTITNSPKFRSDYNIYINQNFSGSAIGRHTIDKDKNITTIGNETKTYTPASFQCDYNLVIFAWNNSDNISNYSNIRLYSFKLYDNDILILNLIPCKNSITNEIGLYDIVENKFYNNNGTGNFIGKPLNMYAKINNNWQAVSNTYVKTNNLWQGG